jgi:HEAT repeat protein
MNTTSSAPVHHRLAVVIAALLLPVFAQGVIAAEPSSSSEPVYQGKSVSDWVAALEPPQSVSTRSKQAEAEEAIHAIGPDAIPSILRYRRGARVQRLELIRHACAVLGPEGEARIVDALNDSDPVVRETALQVLPKTAFQAATDDIIKLVSDPVRPVRAAAVLTLLRLAPDHPETVTALIEALHDTSPAASERDLQFSREDAAVALGKLGPKAKAAIPDLMDLLTDSNDDLREAAASAVWKIERNPSVIPVLAERLQDARDYQTCVRVMKTLAEIGPAAKSAVPVIRKKIEDPGVSFVPATVDLAQVAVDALAKIDPAAAAEARKRLRELPKENPQP